VRGAIRGAGVGGAAEPRAERGAGAGAAGEVPGEGGVNGRRRGETEMMDIKEIQSVLQHRYPFLLVDRGLEREPGPGLGLALALALL